VRAFIYCRVSTKEQSSEAHYSLDNQEERARDYLRMKKWRVAKVRKDVASGKSDEREGFQELLTEIREGRVEAVVVYRLDRLSRNVRDIYGFLDLIRETGVAFVSVTEGFDTSTAMGRAMLGVAAVFAQLTREMIAENTRDGMLRKGLDGYFIGNKTNVFGYDYSPEKGELVVNPREAVIVRQVFNWFTEHKFGTVKIARLLNLQGTRTKAGRQWAHTSIRNMVRNVIYLGEIRVDGEVVAARHPAIISREQFGVAEAIIRGRATLPPRSQQSKHLLSGIAVCGRCGKRLAAHYLHSKTRGYTHVNVFYHHPRTTQVAELGCAGIAKAAPRLEAAVLEKIAEASRSGMIEKLVLADVQSRESKKRVPMLKQRDQLLLELAEMGERFTQWADRLDTGKIDEEQFAVQNQRLLERKAQLQKQLGALDDELEAEQTLEVTLAEVRKALKDFSAVWEALTLEERRETLRLLIEHLKVYKEHAELKLLFLDPISFSTDFRHGTRPRRAPTVPAGVTRSA
jgi:site-specific DNA recombinase